MLDERVRGSHATGAKRGDRLACGWFADRCRYAGTGDTTELHRGRADATGRAVNQQALAGAQRALREQSVVSGCERLGQTARIGSPSLSGIGISGPLVDDRELRLGASADDRHDAIADGEAEAPRAKRCDRSGQLEARDVGGRSRAAPGSAPLTWCRSAAFSPAACTRTRTSPAPGSGSGRRSTTNRPSRMIAARMACEPRVPRGTRARRTGSAASGPAWSSALARTSRSWRWLRTRAGWRTWIPSDRTYPVRFGRPQNSATFTRGSLGLRAAGVPLSRTFALLAQLVEHFHGKEGVIGSSPIEGLPRFCRGFEGR